MVISLQFADINIDLCKLITIINDGNHDKRGGGGDGLQIQASWRVVETYTQAAHTHKSAGHCACVCVYRHHVSTEVITTRFVQAVIHYPKLYFRRIPLCSSVI